MRLDALRAIPLFRDLSDDELHDAAALCRVEEYRDGETILEEGVRATGLWVIQRGGARVLKGIQGRRNQPLAELHEGDHFGEMSLVTDDATTATVQADGDTRLYHLPKDAFHELLARRPAAGQKVLWHFVHTLSRRLAHADRSLARALFVSERRAALAHLFALFRLQTVIVLGYLWIWFRTRVLRWKVPAEKMAAIHRRHARRFKETAFRLKGANVKLGQLASMQAHLLPPEVLEEFRDMRDSVTPTEFPLIASMIQHELGASPFELFEDFDKTPIAAASMAQVHRARLEGGHEVVVKVLHPGLERSVDIDLALMRFMCRALRVFVSSRLDLMQIMREAEEPLRRELDLVHEGKATEVMARAMEPLGVLVPRIHWRYTTRRVLTMDYVEGARVDDLRQLAAWGVDREALMATYLKAFLRQAFEGGYFHADPHPGNVLVTPKGQLVLLDFGMVKQLPDHVREGLMKEILGGFFANPKLYVDGLIQKGAMDEGDRDKMEAFARKAFNDPNTRRLVFDHDVREKGEMKGLFGDLAATIKDMPTFRTPQDNVMFIRALGIIIDVAKEVLPEKKPSDLAFPVMGPVFAAYLQKHPEYAAVTASR